MDSVLKSPSTISSITNATSKKLIFLFIFFAGCDILSLEKQYPLSGGCPLQGSLCIYFFFLDFLDFFCFTSWRAVNVKTKISTKSFIISSISCMVSIPFSPFQCFALICFLSPFYDLIIYRFRYIVNDFF